MSGYPDYPGHNDTDTSIEAAAALSEHLGPLQTRCHCAIRKAGGKGMTPYEAAHLLGVDYTSIHPRFSGLKKKGLIIDSRQRRENPSGKKDAVWVAVRPPSGEAPSNALEGNDGLPPDSR